MDNPTALTIQIFNWWLAFLCTYVLYYTVRLKITNGVDDATEQYMDATLFWLTGLTIARYWFALSRNLAPDGLTWHLGMYSWRWLMLIFTISLIGWGVVSTLQIIMDFGDFKKYAIMISSFIVAMFVGLI